MLRDKWRLERLLGVGGMAAVYEATHRIGRRDAIKILHPAVAKSQELRERFEQEAHAVNRFSHPGAVEIRDIDVTDEGEPFLVMELLDGKPLSERVGREGLIDLDELLRYVDELLDVLAAAHSEGIIHRDIKPDNLFVLTNGRLKVLDFGIARMREGTSKSSRTLVGTRLGTVPYMPPEQVRGLPIDARADLFAVGAMMFRLIARRRVHEAATEAEMVAKMTTEPAPPLAEVAPGAPSEVCLVVDRALAFDRLHRYPDARSMQQDVQAARAGRQPLRAVQMLAQLGPPNARTPTQVLSVAAGASAASDGTAEVASFGELPTAAASPAAPAVVPLGDLPTAATRSSGPGTDATRGACLADGATAAASPSALATAAPGPITAFVEGVRGPASATQPSADPPAAAGATVVSAGAPGPPPSGPISAVPAVAVEEAALSQPSPALPTTAMAPTPLAAPATSTQPRAEPPAALLLAAVGGVLALLLIVGGAWWWLSAGSDETNASADEGASGGAASPPLSAAPTSAAAEPASGTATVAGTAQLPGPAATPTEPLAAESVRPGSTAGITGDEPAPAPTVGEVAQPAPMPTTASPEPSKDRSHAEDEAKPKDEGKGKSRGQGHGKGGGKKKHD